MRWGPEMPFWLQSLCPAHANLSLGPLAVPGMEGQKAQGPLRTYRLMGMMWAAKVETSGAEAKEGPGKVCLH